MTRRVTVYGASVLLLSCVSRLTAQTDVWPDGYLADALANATGQTLSFNVSNWGGMSRSYRLTCPFTSPITQCLPERSTLPLGPGESQVVSVTFSTGSPGTGEVRLNAFDDATGEWDSGYFVVSVRPPYRVAVTPRGRLLVRIIAMQFDRRLREAAQKAQYSKVI